MSTIFLVIVAFGLGYLGRPILSPYDEGLINEKATEPEQHDLFEPDEGGLHVAKIFHFPTMRYRLLRDPISP